MTQSGDLAISVASLSGAMRAGPAWFDGFHPCRTWRTRSVLGEVVADAYDGHRLAVL